MHDLGRYFIRVLNNDRVFVKSNSTGRSASLGSISEIPEFIKADILNEVYLPKVRSNTQFELNFGQSLNKFGKEEV